MCTSSQKVYFSTQTTVVIINCAISQPPAGLGAGCYLAGQLDFGGAVWVSGRSEKGPSISGVDLLLEKQGHFRLHSAWDSERDWKKGHWGSGGHRSLSYSLRPLGGSTAKHHRQILSGGGAAGCQSKVPQTEKWRLVLVTHALQWREVSEEGRYVDVSYAQYTQSSENSKTHQDSKPFNCRLNIFRLKYTIKVYKNSAENISAVMYKRSKGSGHMNTLALRGLLRQDKGSHDTFNKLTPALWPLSSLSLVKERDYCFWIKDNSHYRITSNGYC